MAEVQSVRIDLLSVWYAICSPASRSSRQTNGITLVRDMVCYSIEVPFYNLLLLPSGLCAAIARIPPRKSRFHLVQYDTTHLSSDCGLHGSSRHCGHSASTSARSTFSPRGPPNLNPAFHTWHDHRATIPIHARGDPTDWILVLN